MKQQVSYTSQIDTSFASVRTALDNLLYVSARQSSNLAYLDLVDQILIDPTFPAIPQRRQYALNHLLTQMITDALGCQREIHDLSPVSATDTLSSAEKAILGDVACGSPVLIDWSFLYYRYVRVDLNICLTRFAELLAVEERTVRRYRNRAVQRLTDHLILAEWRLRGGKI